MTAPSDAVTPAPYAAPNKAVMLDVPLAWLVPNSFNPRRSFPEDQLEELAQSLAAHGMLEPIVAREVAWPDGYCVADEAGRPVPCLEIIAGERRFRAARRAGLETVPVRILEGVDDATALRLCVIENLHRQDLDPIEQAEGYKALAEQAGMTQTQIAATVKRSQPAIARSVGLLKLPEDVQELIRTGQLSPSHGEALKHYATFPALCSRLAALAIQHEWRLKVLEGRPHESYELVHEGLVRHVDWHTRFDRSVCKQCPYGAYRKSGYNDDSGYCLRPDHYDELQKVAEEAEAARLAAFVEAAATEGTQVLDLRTVSPNAATDLRMYPDRPAGCSDACPCHTAAIDRWGDPTQACTDPKRFEQLRAKDRKAANARRNALTRARHAEALRRLEAVQLREVPGEPGLRELALVAAAAMELHARQKARDLAAKRAGLDRPPSNRDWIVQNMTPAQVVRLAADVLLTSNMLDATDGDYGDAGLLNWYVGGWEPKEGQADGD